VGERGHRAAIGGLWRVANCTRTRTRIVYCRQTGRYGRYDALTFELLGYSLKPRMAIGKDGLFTTFSPAISGDSAKAIRHASPVAVSPAWAT